MTELRFSVLTDKLVLANQPDIFVWWCDGWKTTEEDSSDTCSKLEQQQHQEEPTQEAKKYKGLKVKVEKMWEVKATVVPVVIGAPRPMAPKLEEGCQQVPGTTSVKCHQPVHMWDITWKKLFWALVTSFLIADSCTCTKYMSYNKNIHKSLNKGNWTSSWILKMFHLSSERLLQFMNCNRFSHDFHDLGDWDSSSTY